jgi:hypothetical protein
METKKIKKVNAAQALSVFMWGNPQFNAVELIKNEVKIDQAKLLEYLMKFQDFIWKYQDII